MYNISKVENIFKGLKVVQIRKSENEHCNYYVLTDKKNLSKSYNPIKMELYIVIVDSSKIYRVRPNMDFTNSVIIYDINWIKDPF